MARKLATFLSTEEAFPLPPGTQVGDARVRGYYIDMRSKARNLEWPPRWRAVPGEIPYDAIAQKALGCFERWLAGEGEEWLAFARDAADHFVAQQATDGGFVHIYELGHTFPIRPPSLSAMAQGQCASLLVRVHGETGEERYAEAARRALRPMSIPSAEGGVRATLDGGPWLEEYPTQPPSFVLNGGIFAMWGLYDVGLGLDDEAGRADYARCADALAANLHRWDTGYWSRYDLFPHPVTNVASLAYHALHTSQVKAMHALDPRPEFAERIAAWERYGRSRAARSRAFAAKALFRVLVPHNRRLARLMPWRPRLAT
jgi:heparosan-N-sulfate-glucuronate 5-epimerase